VCKEVGAPYKYITVDLVAGEHKSPAYLEKQPFGQVPAIDVSQPAEAFYDRVLTILQDDGFKLYESRAIARYIAAKAGSPLLPNSDPKKLGEFEVAASIEHSNFDPYVTQIASEKFYKP
jgi:glutathione S-transferase